jgi:hypothetical protein
VWADDFRVLLLVLDRLLSRPGPPDPDTRKINDEGDS